MPVRPATARADDQAAAVAPRPAGSDSPGAPAAATAVPGTASPDAPASTSASTPDAGGKSFRAPGLDGVPALPGLAALGAPIYGRNHRLVGALSISETPEIVLSKRLEKLGYELTRAAADISREMGCSFSGSIRAAG